MVLLVIAAQIMITEKQDESTNHEKVQDEGQVSGTYNVKSKSNVSV